MSFVTLSATRRRVASSTLALATSLALAASPAAAQSHYTFLSQYLGGGTFVELAGSAPFQGTTLQAGDSYFWRVTTNGGAWRVTTPGFSYFPFLALDAQEGAVRTANLSLRLFNGAAQVFTQSWTNDVQSYAHAGTNTVSLAQGLTFDRAELDYTLLSAIDNFTDPNNPVDVGTTATGATPWGGAWDVSPYSPGIVYGRSQVVPEPASVALMGVGLLAVGIAARRRRGVPVR